MCTVGAVLVLPVQHRLGNTRTVAGFKKVQANSGPTGACSARHVRKPGTRRALVREAQSWMRQAHPHNPMPGVSEIKLLTGAPPYVREMTRRVRLQPAHDIAEAGCPASVCPAPCAQIFEAQPRQTQNHGANFSVDTGASLQSLRI